MSTTRSFQFVYIDAARDTIEESGEKRTLERRMTVRIHLALTPLGLQEYIKNVGAGRFFDRDEFRNRLTFLAVDGPRFRCRLLVGR